MMRSGWWLLPGVILGVWFWATVLFSGTWQEVKDFDTETAYIPPDTACLSSCCLAFLKAPQRVNDGICGLHMPYDPEAGLTPGWFAAFEGPHVQVIMDKAGIGGWFNYMRENTTTRIFLMFKDGHDPWLQSWLELDGYAIVSDVNIFHTS